MSELAAGKCRRNQKQQTLASFTPPPLRKIQQGHINMHRSASIKSDKAWKAASSRVQRPIVGPTQTQQKKIKTTIILININCIN
jgi:hypothetical protein